MIYSDKEWLYIAISGIVSKDFRMSKDYRIVEGEDEFPPPIPKKALKWQDHQIESTNSKDKSKT